MAKQYEEEQEKKLFERWKSELKEAGKENIRRKRSQRDKSKGEEREKGKEERGQKSISIERKGRLDPGFPTSTKSRAPPAIVTATTKTKGRTIPKR